MSARLHIFAPLASLAARSTEPGEVNGLPITAAALRDLLTRIDALGLRTPTGGSLTLALTGPDGALRATVTLDQLRRLTRHACPQHPEGDCDCPLLYRPATTESYEPTAAQRVFVKTRDRTCRFPNCGQRVGWADLDHVLEHAAGGATDCGNLCCLCRSHHRLKTANKTWSFTMGDDGTLTVTTPTGITRTTRPPGIRRAVSEPPETAGGGEPPETGDEPPPAANGGRGDEGDPPF